MPYANDDLIKAQYSDRQRSILIGSVLGDGCLYWQDGCRYPLFRNSFSAKKYAAYCEWKMEELSDFDPKLHSSWKYKQIYMSPHPYFEELYHLFYEPEPKHLSDEALDLVDELALAVWWMDDGSYVPRNGTGKLATQSFSCDEHLLMEAWFKEQWDVTPKTYLCDTGRHCLHKLGFSRVEMEKLATIIEPHVIPSMSYRIGC